MNNTCNKCAYFCDDEDQTGLDKELLENMGECRRYPPLINNDQYQNAIFPLVMPFLDWCGEFEKIGKI